MFRCTVLGLLLLSSCDVTPVPDGGAGPDDTPETCTEKFPSYWLIPKDKLNPQNPSIRGSSTVDLVRGPLTATVRDDGFLIRSIPTNTDSLPFDKNEMGFGLNAVRIAPNRTVAVGLSGRLVSIPNDPGSNAIAVQADTQSDLNAVWTNLDGDAVAVGSNGTVVTYKADGTLAFQSVGSSDLFGVFGLEDGSFWAVGADSSVLKSDHGIWSPISVPSALQTTFRAVTGTATDVWVAGTNGQVWHFDGRDWNPIDSGTSADINTLWLDALSHEIWVAGANNTIRKIRADGTSEKFDPNLGERNSPESIEYFTITGVHTKLPWAISDRIMAYGSLQMGATRSVYCPPGSPGSD